MSKFQATVNFEKLNEVPYMKNFSGNPKFQMMVSEFIEMWSKQTEQGLDDVALIRAVECTNGCTQYAFRDQEKFALSLEQTRECMKLSMGFIKNKSITLDDGTLISVDKSVYDVLDYVRDIYIEGFKNNNDDKVMEFYAQSVAQFYVLGEERLTKQLDFVEKHFGHIFTPEFIERGRKYILKYLEVVQ